uniref:SAM-dependent MTase RsmB/NOP-type domain-containing protein n=1 Tax=Romanomermis culicivorax TaxID=13658 RepID=A0A915JTY2_ROMCU
MLYCIACQVFAVLFSMRILPHQQDTGGFFVALLKKTNKFPWTMNISRTGIDNHESDSSSPRKQKRFKGYKEDPFVFLSKDDVGWKAVESYFDIAPGFPVCQLLRRGYEANKKRNLYFVNDVIKRIIENNNDSIKIINAGTRLFSRVDVKESGSQIRLTQDSINILLLFHGVNILLPYIRKRLVEISRDELINVLTKSINNCYHLDNFCPDSRARFEPWGEGSIVLLCQFDGHPVAVCAWRGKHFVSPYLAKDSILHILRMIKYDTTEYENEMINEKRRKKPIENAVDESPDAQNEFVDAQEGQSMARNRRHVLEDNFGRRFDECATESKVSSSIGLNAIPLDFNAPKIRKTESNALRGVFLSETGEAILISCSNNHNMKCGVPPITQTHTFSAPGPTLLRNINALAKQLNEATRPKTIKQETCFMEQVSVDETVPADLITNSAVPLIRSENTLKHKSRRFSSVDAKISKESNISWPKLKRKSLQIGESSKDGKFGSLPKSIKKCTALANCFYNALRSGLFMHQSQLGSFINLVRRESSANSGSNVQVIEQLRDILTRLVPCSSSNNFLVEMLNCFLSASDALLVNRFHQYNNLKDAVEIIGKLKIMHSLLKNTAFIKNFVQKMRSNVPNFLPNRHMFAEFCRNAMPKYDTNLAWRCLRPIFEDELYEEELLKRTSKWVTDNWKKTPEECLIDRSNAGRHGQLLQESKDIISGASGKQHQSCHQVAQDVLEGGKPHQSSSVWRF